MKKYICTYQKTEVIHGKTVRVGTIIKYLFYAKNLREATLNVTEMLKRKFEGTIYGFVIDRVNTKRVPWS